MPSDLLAALCLVLVIEGLLLLAAPSTWKQVTAQLQQTPVRTLRVWGAAAAAVGLILLQWVR